MCVQVLCSALEFGDFVERRLGGVFQRAQNISMRNKDFYQGRF